MSYEPTAVITGAAQGIGAAIAKRCTRDHRNVVIADIEAEAAERTAAALAEQSGATVLSRHIDVTDSGSVEDAAAALTDRFGAVDTVVNNAGIATNAPSFEMTDQQWQQTLAVNLTGPFFVSRAFGKRMRERGGAIVNVSSIAAFKATRPEVHVAYDATKAGIIGMTRTLAAEWAPHGIRVNAIAPGYTNTAILDAVGRDDPQTLQAWQSQTPQQRLIEPEEIAEAAGFLAGGTASAVTGHVLLADGGYTAW